MPAPQNVRTSAFFAAPKNRAPHPQRNVNQGATPSRSEVKRNSSSSSLITRNQSSGLILNILTSCYCILRQPQACSLERTSSEDRDSPIVCSVRVLRKLIVLSDTFVDSTNPRALRFINTFEKFAFSGRRWAGLAQFPFVNNRLTMRLNPSARWQLQNRRSTLLILNSHPHLKDF